MAWMAQGGVATPGSPPTRESLLFHTLFLPKGSGHQFLSHRPSRVGCRPRPQCGGDTASTGTSATDKHESPAVKRVRPASLSSRLHVLCPRELAPSEGASPVVSRSPTLRPRQGLLAFEPLLPRDGVKWVRLEVLKLGAGSGEGGELAPLNRAAALDGGPTGQTLLGHVSGLV